MPAMKRRKFELGKAHAGKDLIRPKEIGEPGTRAAIYARVSTEEQAEEGFSLDSQIDRMKAYCESREWIPSGLYVDEGATGRDTKRDEYQKMIADQEKWDVIAVVKMDRIHRNAKNMMYMMESLQKRGKGFFSLSESLDTSTAMGRFVMDIIARIAQLESETIGERALAGMTQAIKEGEIAMGQRAAFGYRWQHRTGQEDGMKFGTHAREGSVLIPDPETAPTVKKIFKLYGKGMSHRKISVELGWCQCKPREIRRRYPKKNPETGKIEMELWIGKGLQGDCRGCMRVRYILRNPVYVGLIVWGDAIHPGSHEPLIEREAFDRVNKRRRFLKVVLPEIVAAPKGA